MSNSPAGQILPVLETVSLERDGHVLLIGLNRPHKRNAFDRAMLADLSRAYGVLESDPEVRAGVLFAHGEHFTAGLDLADVGPAVADPSMPTPTPQEPHSHTTTSGPPPVTFEISTDLGRYRRIVKIKGDSHYLPKPDLPEDRASKAGGRRRNTTVW